MSYKMTNKKQEERKEEKGCTDKKCPIHGKLSTRGRQFKGYVKKIVGSRAVIEWDRFIYYPKYERYAKARSRIHAHIPACLNIKQGDYVLVRECRPLSKIIHFVVLKVEKAEKEIEK
jgi:small subunit ribosomal protein S17